MNQNRVCRCLPWVASALLVCATQAAGESLRGTVTLVGPDGAASRKSDRAGVVVWLEPVAGSPGISTGPPKAPMSMRQRNTSFMPRVIAVEVGTAVDFPNADPIMHNVFSNYDGQVFDLQLYAPQTTRRVVFRRPGMVRVFCNIHEAMSAIVAVMPTPYFAVTDAGGNFEIEAPGGEYRLRFWHERASPDALGLLEQRISVRQPIVALGETQIAVSNEPPPHKDKYGRDYKDRVDERIFYAGARR